MEDTNKVVDLQSVRDENVGNVAENAVDDGIAVTRGELKEVLGQIMGNMNQMSGYLIEDINALFRNHVYPIKLKMQAMSELFEEKEYVSKDEIEKRAQEIHNKTVEEAKAQLKKEADEAESVGRAGCSCGEGCEECSCGDGCSCEGETCDCEK